MLSIYLLPKSGSTVCCQQIRSYMRMLGRWGKGMGRAIGNADCACGILMAVLVTSCALGFVYVFTRARTHVWENTRFYSLHFHGPFGKELWRIYDMSFTSWRAYNLCCKVLKMQNCDRNSDYVIDRY